MKVLVAGFGPFGEVMDNPSARLALALDGAIVNGVCIIGREMPVSYQRSVQRCVEWAAEFDVGVVIGVGVAVSRERVTVERTGAHPQDILQADVDGGVTVKSPQHAPSQVRATLDTEQLALHLDAVVGDDAGRYVCNAWLYQAVQQIDVPVGFLHIPPKGLDSERLRFAIGEMWGEKGLQPNSMT
jgi:pyroglutamyl-peptidase